MKKLFALILLLISITDVFACNGGTPADYNKYPYLAVYHGTVLPIIWNTSCIAAITNSNTAIIAAHCFTQQSLNFFQSYLYIINNSQLIPTPVAQTYINSLFTAVAAEQTTAKNLGHDTAVIQLKSNQSINQFLMYNPQFNPNLYIDKQPNHEIEFPYFGIDKNSLIVHYNIKLILLN